MRCLSKVSSVLVAAALLAGCANQRAPVEAALNSADDSFAPVRAEAAKYVPDQAKAVEQAISAARDALARGDYAAALAGAQALPARIDDLKAALATRKGQLMVRWTDIENDLPRMAAAITSRSGALSKSKRLPKGLDRAAFDRSKASFDQVKTLWSEATAAAGSGDLSAAIAKGEEARGKATEILSLLGVQPPAVPEMK